jgi:hypothetical protein
MTLKWLLLPLLLSLASMVAAEQKSASPPLEHVTYRYDDALWEGRVFPNESTNFGVRLKSANIVFILIEDKSAPKGMTTKKALDIAEVGMRSHFALSDTTALDHLNRPTGWDCRTYDARSNGDELHYVAMECIRLDPAYVAALTIIIPFEADLRAFEQLNAVISSVRPVKR